MKKQREFRRGHKVTKATINGVVEYIKTINETKNGVKHENYKPVIVTKVQVTGDNHLSRRQNMAFQRHLPSLLKKIKANNHQKLLAQQRKQKVINRINKQKNG